MSSIWDGKYVNLRCLKSADVNSFFYKDRLYHRLNQGNYEIIYTKDVEALNNFYRPFIIFLARPRINLLAPAAAISKLCVRLSSSRATST